MSATNKDSAPGPTPDLEEAPIPELEVDQTVPPRPEEEIADVLRADPDTQEQNSPTHKD